jgi:acetyl-CoA synthetase
MSYPFQINSIEQYKAAYEGSIANLEGFWANVAENFSWRKKWDKVVDWEFATPKVEWFKGGTLNITENCLDRHLEKNGKDIAIIWEPNSPEEQAISLTYEELYQKVIAFAQVLRNNNIKKGDRVCIYMGMVPELAIAVLACARIGAIHSVIFGGFSAQSIADRLQDANATAIITCDIAYRGNKTVPLKDIVDEALLQPNEVKTVIVYNRGNAAIKMHSNRDIFWQAEIEKLASMRLHPDTANAEEMEAEDPLFILYTSGSTGKPKGVVHTTAGYMIWATYSFVNVFQYQKGQIHFCTADIGWITGHSYIIYAPLCAGATTVMFEGIPTWPDAGRFWDIVDKHQVNILYTSPTAIRSLMSFGEQPFENKKLNSLKVLGTVGEPINEEAWHWYDKHVGKGKCPIVDTWWQTETGGVLISNLAGITPSKPSWATLPLPGVQPILVDEKGNEITAPDEEGLYKGNLCLKAAWPGILRTTYGDHERCRTNYFATYSNLYFTGDGAIKDSQGNFRITGRVDDVLNISGHRIGTAEVENAINSNEHVIESAVVGFPHDIKGQAMYAFVICDSFPANEEDKSSFAAAITQSIVKQIGAIAKPDKIQFVTGLPKTRSGKIMRRILRKIAEGEIQQVGDTTTLLDPDVVQQIIAGRIN